MDLLAIAVQLTLQNKMYLPIYLRKTCSYQIADSTHPQINVKYKTERQNKDKVNNRPDHKSTKMERGPQKQHAKNNMTNGAHKHITTNNDRQSLTEMAGQSEATEDRHRQTDNGTNQGRHKIREKGGRGRDTQRQRTNSGHRDSKDPNIDSSDRNRTIYR